MRTGVEKHFLLRVYAEPRHKSWLEFKKCHCAIICFGSWI